MTRYYPINLDIKNKNCVVIGGGEVARRKINQLLDSGARVTLISPKISQGLKKMVKNKKIIFKKKAVGLNDFKNAFLVICATGNRKINSSISSFCRKKGILINVVDSPGECSFILPSVVKRGSLNISISTSGASPSLAAKIRQDLEKQFGLGYAKFLSIMKSLRPKVTKEIKNIKLRKAYFKKVTSPKIINFCKKNNSGLIKQKLEQILSTFRERAFIKHE